MSERIIKNAAWATSATLVGSLAGLIAVAVLLRTVGASRLGIFTIAVGLIGFTGIFDLGLGRALTQRVASDLGGGRSRAEISGIVWKILSLLAAVGVTAALTLWWLVPAVVTSVFDLEHQLAGEVVFGLHWVVLSIPMALVGGGAVAALEGLQEFRRLSLQRMMLSIVQFGLPMGISLLEPDVGWVIAGLAFSRALAMLVWLATLRQLLPRTGAAMVKRQDLNSVLRFGGWVSLSNIINPLMTYADRFYLASIFPPAAVAHYAVPLDGFSRMTTLPATAVGVLFPVLAESRGDPEKSSKVASAASMSVIILMMPTVFLVSVLSSTLLRWWLGRDFALEATQLTQWLLLGIFANCVAYIPFSLLQGHGRSDLTAKLHVAELPIFFAILAVGVDVWGIVGAAIAWTARVALDALLLHFTLAKVLPASSASMKANWHMAILGGIVLLIPMVDAGWPFSIIGGLLILFACGAAGIQLFPSLQAFSMRAK